MRTNVPFSRPCGTSISTNVLSLPDIAPASPTGPALPGMVASLFDQILDTFERSGRIRPSAMARHVAIGAVGSAHHRPRISVRPGQRRLTLDKRDLAKPVADIGRGVVPLHAGQRLVAI